MRIISLIDDQRLVKKVPNRRWTHTNRLRMPLWYIRLWRSPPTEAFIIYDESSSPGAKILILTTKLASAIRKVMVVVII